MSGSQNELPVARATIEVFVFGCTFIYHGPNRLRDFSLQIQEVMGLVGRYSAAWLKRYYRAPTRVCIGPTLDLAVILPKVRRRRDASTSWPYYRLTARVTASQARMLSVLSIQDGGRRAELSRYYRLAVLPDPGGR
jgi:hypothetical protein